MFGTIRRHQGWLWVVIASITILTMLSFLTPGSRSGAGLRSMGSGYTIAGHPVTENQINDARREVVLQHFLQTQQWPDSDSPAVELQTWQRLLLIQKQQDLGIHTSAEAAATVAQQILRQWSMAQGGTVTIDDFDKMLTTGGLDAGDLDRFLRHELGREQLVRMMGVTGKLVTPQEAEMMYRRENEEFATTMVSFPASNYLAGVTVTPEALAQFYSNRLANYRIPERVEVSYVKFDVTNYTAEAQAALTNLDRLVEDNYRKYGTNVFPEAKTPEETKAKLRVELVKNEALKDAHRAANEFATELDKKQPRNASSMDELAKSRGLTVGVTRPFDSEDGPTDLKAPENFTRAAFKTTLEDPFAGPIVGTNGAYVLALKKQLPSEFPPLKDIEAKVTEDYRKVQALQLAQQAATKFHDNLTNGLAQGKTFAAISADAKVKPETLPPLSIGTQAVPKQLEGRVDLGMLRQAIFPTPVGSASPPMRMNDGLFVVYVEKKLPVDEAKLKTELPEFTSVMRETRENEAYQGWFMRQIQSDQALYDRVSKLYQQVQERAAAARSEQ